MANAGPGTNGSQFFLTHSAQRHLDGLHTVFGKAVDGKSKRRIPRLRKGDALEQVRILRVGEAYAGYQVQQSTFDALRGVSGDEPQGWKKYLRR